MKEFVVLIALISLANTVLSQHKFEKEIRIQKTEAPENAVGFVDSMKLYTKIKWYKELGYNKTSYEAKTKYKGERLSIEFSEEGAFEDLEIEIKPEAIPSASYNKITDYFDSALTKYVIKKVQIQYSGNQKSILNSFLNEETPHDIIVHSEIVISTKLDGSFIMFEYLFDENGKFVQKSQIILKMTDNIEY